MAKRAPARLTVSELVTEASDFSREAWRSCWLPILAVTAGHTLMFMHGHVAASDWRPGLFRVLAVFLMLFYVPLYGGLYRIAIGGRPAAGRRFGGLQWNGVEWRLIAVAVVVFFLAGLAIVPVLALIGILALLPGSHRAMSLGPLGTLSHWAVESIPVWLLFFWLAAPRIARLMLGWAYSTAREKTEPFAGLEPAKASGWAIAWTLALSWIPLGLGYLTVFALTLIEGDALAPGAWPLPEAIGAGILLGAVSSAMVAPLLVGTLTGAYWLLEEDAEGVADGDRFAFDTVEPPAAPEHFAPEHVEPEHPAPPGHPAPHVGVEAGVAAAAAAAAALAAQQAAELDLPPSEVDHGLTEPAAAGHDAPVETAPEAAHTIGADTPFPVEPVPVDPAGVEPPEPEAPLHADVAAADAEAEHAAAAHAAEAAALAAAVAAAAHAAHHEPEPAAEHAPEPAAELYDAEPPEPPEPAPADGEPLSPWPHSVLPPWPVREAAPAAATQPPPAAKIGPEGFPPLARPGEPSHRFVEITELE